jgi:hypothetical protein
MIVRNLEGSGVFILVINIFKTTADLFTWQNIKEHRYKMAKTTN